MFFFEFSENVFLKNTSGRVFLKFSTFHYVWISGIFYAVVLNVYLKKLLCLEYVWSVRCEQEQYDNRQPVKDRKNVAD